MPRSTAWQTQASALALHSSSVALATHVSREAYLANLFIRHPLTPLIARLQTRKATLKTAAHEPHFTIGSRYVQHGSAKHSRTSKAVNGSCLNGKSLLRRNHRESSWARVSKSLASLADEWSNLWDPSTLLSPVGHPDETKSHSQSWEGYT